MEDVFNFKRFSITQDRRLMRVNTDGVLLAAWANLESASNILDIGSGTGVIALMSAQRNHSAKIDSIEIDSHASSLSKRNFKASPWSDRLNQINGKFPNDIKIYGKYDYMISNPPFFSNGTMSTDPNQRTSRHTLHLPQKDLVDGVIKLLDSEGVFGLILPLQEAKVFETLGNEKGIYCFRRTFVRPNPQKRIERVLMEFSKKEKNEKLENELTIRITEPNQYTTAYKKLTQAFYLNF